MFAHAHGGNGGRAVHMIGTGNRDRIDGTAQLLEHLAPVFELFGVVGAALLGGSFLEALVSALQPGRVHITDRDDISAGGEGMSGIAVPFPADTDGGDVDSFIRAEDASDAGKREGGGSGSQRGAAEERATI